MEQKQPLISVIVPVYKVEAYLSNCLDSLLAQSHQNLEIIAVDDGSPDNCGAILDKYAKQDARIHVIHQQNGGLAAARNAGLRLAAGEYLAFLDSDDTAEPALYETLLAAQLRDGTKLSVSGYHIAWESGEKTPVAAIETAQRLSPERALALLIADAPFKNFVWNKLYRRELFDGLTFPAGTNFEDVPLMYRLFERAGAVSIVPDCLVNYLQRAGSIIGQRKLRDELDGCLHFLARYHDLSKRQPALEPLLLYCFFTPVVRHAALVGAQNKPAAHRAETERKRTVTAFLREHRGELRPLLGCTDRVILALLLCETLPTDYAAGAIAAGMRVLEKLHIAKPRSVPQSLMPKEEA